MWTGPDKPDSAGMEAILASVQEQMALLAELSEQRAAIAVSSTTADGRVTATVDADGHLVGIDFSAEIDRLSYAEIAAAVVATTKQATAEAVRRGAELAAPLLAGRDRMPTLDELVEGLPDLGHFPSPVLGRGSGRPGRSGPDFAPHPSKPLGSEVTDRDWE